MIMINIKEAVNDIDWVYFYSQIPCDYLPDDIKSKLIVGFDFTKSQDDMEIILDIIMKHKESSFLFVLLMSSCRSFLLMS